MAENSKIEWLTPSWGIKRRYVGATGYTVRKTGNAIGVDAQ